MSWPLRATAIGMPAVHPNKAENETAKGGSIPTDGDERRGSGMRNRRSDRLMDRATREYTRSAGLKQAKDVENLLLFIDDDMRETALAMSRIESFLHDTLRLLEAPKLTRAEVHDLASDREVLEHVDMLNETLESLRRRMARLASKLK